jgi:hypothetical protein
MSDNQNEHLDTARYRVHQAKADLAFHLERLGDQLAETYDYKAEGIEAVQFHLMQKHHWLPQDVRSLNIDDLWFAAGQERRQFSPQKT